MQRLALRQTTPKQILNTDSWRAPLKRFRLLGRVTLLVSLIVPPPSRHASASEPLPPPPTVESVDLTRYLGKWYEIAAFPQRFQKGCTGSIAEYSQDEDGELKVLNTCNLESLSGPLKVAKGRIKVVDAKSKSKLKVSFFWPFYGDYWIFDLGPNYETAIVGSPDRDYLWFLSRIPQIPAETYLRLHQKAKDLGFDLSRLVKTLQSPDPAPAPIASPSATQATPKP